MAISSVAKNLRDGSITLSDGTGTPITITVQYENGDFSISGLRQGTTDVNKYLDRGVFFSARKVNQTFPTFSFSSILTDLSDASEKCLVDACLKTGAFASGVSTLGANADVWAIKTVFTIEGTDHGDTGDHVLRLNDCVITDVGISEGDPDNFSISGEVLGSITMS